jgi:DNA ligase-1
MSNAIAKVNPDLVMTSCDVFGIIENIANAKGKDKQVILAEYMDDPMMRLVLRATYDPFTTYGIKQIPESKVAGAESFSEDTIHLLTQLFKRELTGNAAKAAIMAEMDILSQVSQTLLTRILKKDLRAGFTAGTCNRVEPGFIFVFECMLAHKFEEKRIKAWPVAAEPKYDGVRSLMIWDGTDVTFFSRTGKVFEGMAPIATLIKAQLREFNYAPVVLDGELTDKGNQFNKIVGDVHKKDFEASDAVFFVFEAIALADFQNDSDTRLYRERRMALAGMFERIGLTRLANVKIAPVRVMQSVKQINDWATDIMQAGGEGLIVKPLDGLYEKKRSYNWLKIKGKGHLDLLIVGTEQGEGKYADMIGKLIVDFNGVLVGVGSGLSDDIRAQDPEQLIGRMCEVSYHEVTPDLSLRHPVFERFRDDKPVEDGPGV